MIDTTFLVDNNALTALTTRRIESDFFRTHCVITPDVLWEASGRKEQAALESSLVEMDAGSFALLRDVMSTLAIGDVELVNLFRNKGSADPMLVAVILQARHRQEGMLLSTDWVLVTDDKPLLRKAREFDIDVWPSAQLKQHMDASVDDSH